MLTSTTKTERGFSHRIPHPEKSAACRPQHPKVQQILRRSRLQEKLKIGAPNDRYEQEADRVADQVMRMPQPQVQRQALPEEEEPEELLQRTPSGNAQMAPSIVSSELSTPGQPLDQGTRSLMEGRFGQDFSQVRVHTSSQSARSATAVGARAYTVWRDVGFGKGEYAPGTGTGNRLLAHELTHVVEQGGPDSTRNFVQRTDNAEEDSESPECNLVSKTPMGTRYLFSRGSDELENDQRELLKTIARDLPEGASVDILGLASSDGSAEFNATLSCRRADAAAAVFREAGKASNIRLVEATGEVPGTDYDPNFMAVDLAIHIRAPSLPPTARPTPISPVPTIPVAGCPCPSANPSCAPAYCTPMNRTLALADRLSRGPGLLAVLAGLGGTGVGGIYFDFIWGGRSGVVTLSTALRDEFAAICQTEVATNYIMAETINTIWGMFPASTPAQSIRLSAIAPTAASDIGTPGNVHQLVYCGATNAPGLLAGGIGTTQTTTPIGAIPSTQNDSRSATGHIDVTRQTLPGGGSRLVFTPVVDIEVRDTVDFCPGNCGGMAAQVATIALSQWESSGISGDVAFVTQFAAPPGQLRKIVLTTVSGVESWSLEPV